MSTIDLRQLRDDIFTVHFGGRLAEVDAVTFGNALVGLAEALQAINAQTNPGHGLEVRLEATGEGSFRAVLKLIQSPLRSIFSGARVEAVLLGILSSFLYGLIDNGKPNIIVNTDEVIIETGRDRVIVPRSIYDKAEKIKHDPAVKKGIHKAVDAVIKDPAVSNLGFTPSASDVKPLVIFDRDELARIQKLVLPSEEDGDVRVEDQEAQLVIHKAVLERSTRKWEFVWNGFRISAPILDDEFFDRLVRREVSIMQGDVFEAILRIYRRKDQMTGAWVNERFQVIRLGRKVRPFEDQGRFEWPAP